MAEKQADQKPTMDKILDCSLCHQQLRNPHRLQQCLHSFCKHCIEEVPKVTRDGKQGCPCPQCKTFSSVEEIQQDTFINEILSLQNAPTGADVVKPVCVQCGTQEEVTGKCADCKIELCGKGQSIHLKIPMLRGHNIVPIDEECSKIIDRVIFCPEHENEIMKLNCETCNKIICLCCKATEHESHKTEFVPNAVERMVPKMETKADMLVNNIDIINAQIHGVKCKIKEVKESYASCRLAMDDHLEKVRSRLRAMKAKMEDDVTEQESVALDTLDSMKSKLESQLSKVSNFVNLISVVKDYSTGVSMLSVMQGGIYNKARDLAEAEYGNLSFTIPEVTFAESQVLERKFTEIFGDVSFHVCDSTIIPSGEIFQEGLIRERFEDFLHDVFWLNQWIYKIKK